MIEFKFGMDKQNEIDGAECENKKRKAGKIVQCTKITDTCLQKSCPHKFPHVCYADCFEKKCLTDEREILVECKIVEEK